MVGKLGTKLERLYLCVFFFFLPMTSLLGLLTSIDIYLTYNIVLVSGIQQSDLTFASITD